ncbi:hypothetical protein LINPERHAP1_LOCUS14115 [Linum perenne]
MIVWYVLVMRMFGGVCVFVSVCEIRCMCDSCVCALNVDVRCLVLCCGLCWIDL